MPKVKKGATDQTFYVKLVDSTAGTPESDYTITDLDLTYVRDRAAAVKADATALTTVSDAHADNKAIQVSKTTAPGLYRVDFPDAAFSDNATVDRVQLLVIGSGLDPAVLEVELEKYDVSDVYEYVSDVKSELILTHSETTEILTDTGTTIPTKVDSDSLLYLADHDKTQSDVADLSTKVDSDALLVKSDLSDIKSELIVVHSETTETLSEVHAFSDTGFTVASLVSDVKESMEGAGSILSDLQSDTTVILSDLTKTKLSDLATAASITTLSAKVDSDALLYLADHDKTQSDVADLSTKVDSDALLYLADHDKTQSDVADLVTKVDSDALLVQSDLSDIKSELVVVHSDTTAIEAGGGALTSDQAAMLVDIYSDTTAIESGGGALTSDQAAMLADIYSDTTVIEAAGGGLTAGQASDLAAIESELILTHSETTAIQGIVSDIQSDTNKVVSDLTKTAVSDLATAASITTLSSKVDSDALLYLADHDKTQSDVADLSTKVDYDAVLYLADHDKTQSDVADLVTKIDSDALLYLSDLSDIRSELVLVHSETTAVQGIVSDVQSDTNKVVSDLTKTAISNLATSSAITTLSSKVDSDALLYLADHDKTQSDVADLSIKVDSDALLVQSDLSDVKSELVAVHSETTVIQTGVAVTDKTGFKLASDGLDLISTTAPTGVASNFREMLVQVWRRFFKKADKTATQIRTYADDGIAVATTQTISETETTETQGAAS